MCPRCSTRSGVLPASCSVSLSCSCSLTSNRDVMHVHTSTERKIDFCAVRCVPDTGPGRVSRSLTGAQTSLHRPPHRNRHLTRRPVVIPKASSSPLLVSHFNRATSHPFAPSFSAHHSQLIAGLLNQVLLDDEGFEEQFAHDPSVPFSSCTNPYSRDSRWTASKLTSQFHARQTTASFNADAVHYTPRTALRSAPRSETRKARPPSGTESISRAATYVQRSQGPARPLLQGSGREDRSSIERR